MKIIIIGIQGSGKSTQGNFLSEKLKVPYLSTGHIFREMAKEKTPLGRYIKETMTAGFLIPDGKTLTIVEEYLKKPEYQNGYIIDGFPRTCKQAEAFKDKIDKVIYLKVSDKEALWRLSYRNGEVREDETVLAVRKRIELFHEVTKPVIEHYRRKRILVEVDGEKHVEEVSKEILAKI
jgi:adenylate kinase